MPCLSAVKHYRTDEIVGKLQFCWTTDIQFSLKMTVQLTYGRRRFGYPCLQLGEKRSIWGYCRAQVDELLDNFNSSCSVYANRRINSRIRRVYRHNFWFIPVYLKFAAFSRKIRSTYSNCSTESASMERSLAKSAYETMLSLNLCPKLRREVAFVILWSMTILKSSAATAQPWCTPVVIWKNELRRPLTWTQLSLPWCRALKSLQHFSGSQSILESNKEFLGSLSRTQYRSWRRHE